MSSQPVRDRFRARLATLLTPLGFTYVESVNLAEPASELPARWYTLDFGAAGDERLSLGIPTLFRETGSASALIFTQQQIGDAEAGAAAQRLRDALANWHEANADGDFFRILDCSPPSDLDGGDFRGAWYALSVDLRYQFDRLVGEAEAV
jgi:hypothetical protein